MQTPLSVLIEKAPDLENVQIARFTGAFDGGVKEPLADLENLVSSAPPKTILLFDFTNLEFLNSYAIGLLVSWQNHMLKNEGEVIIAAVNKHVEDIFNILGISNLFKIFPDVEGALATLKS